MSSLILMEGEQKGGGVGVDEKNLTSANLPWRMSKVPYL